MDTNYLEVPSWNITSSAPWCWNWMNFHWFIYNFNDPFPILPTEQQVAYPHRSKFTLLILSFLGFILLLGGSILNMYTLVNTNMSFEWIPQFNLAYYLFFYILLVYRIGKFKWCHYLRFILISCIEILFIMLNIYTIVVLKPKYNNDSKTNNSIFTAGYNLIFIGILNIVRVTILITQ